MLNLPAQVIGVIQSKETKKGIPYVLVFTSDLKTGVYTDSSGVFQLNANPKDTLVIRHVGYQEKRIVTNNISTQDTIFLKEAIYEMKEYSVNALPSKKSPKQKPASELCSCTGFSSKVGMWLKTDDGLPQQLQGLSIYITNSGIPKTPFRIMIRDGVDQNSKMSITYSIIGEAKSGNSWVDLKLKEPISLDAPLFLEIEWLKSSANSYKSSASKRECFGICIGLSKTDAKNNFWMNSNEKGWTQIQGYLGDYALMIKPLVSKY